MTRTATIGSALAAASARIDRVDAVYLLCFATRRKRAFLAAFPEQSLTTREDALFETLVASREMGVPVAYLINTREFYGREFAVDSRALIPRPETETLIEAALARWPAGLAQDAAVTLLDVGTGSGIIGITLALERPGAVVLATDLSLAALDLAAENARRLGLAEPRWRAAVGRTYEPVVNERFDFIVSNPPYIGGGDAHLVQGDLRFEPGVALTDGSDDGLGTIRQVVAGAMNHLKPNGWLLLEHGYDQAAMVRNLLTQAGFVDIFSAQDLASIERVSGGRLAG